MISSPGCLCRIDGASGLSSTRFWIITRPGMLSSFFCRSVRQSPGACCTVAIAFAPCRCLADGLVRTGRRGSGAGQPVERDVVEDVVAGEVARRHAVDEGARDLVVAIGVVVEHPGG